MDVAVRPTMVPDSSIFRVTVEVHSLELHTVPLLTFFWFGPTLCATAQLRPSITFTWMFFKPLISVVHCKL